MRIVLDTNVLVSAFLRRGTPPADVWERVFREEWGCVVTPPILEEYDKVLRRPKFMLSVHVIGEVVDFARGISLATPRKMAKLPLPDPTDLPFLEAALHYQVDALVTGNKKDFPAGVCRPIPVMSPAEVLERFG